MGAPFQPIDVKRENEHAIGRDDGHFQTFFKHTKESNSGTMFCDIPHRSKDLPLNMVGELGWFALKRR